MKITIMAICGEADHPLLPVFKKYYSDFPMVIQMGVTEKWLSVNGDTSGSGNIFPEKVDQQNEALRMVPDDTNFLFFLDIDEFLPVQWIENFKKTPEESWPDIVRFQMNHFWKGGDYVGTGGQGWGFDAWCPRIGRHYPGMRYSSHRPPTLILPDGKQLERLIRMENCFDEIINHYSYVYRETIIRKLKYYNLIYTQFDYLKWFHEVWDPWTPQNREEIERIHSIHPSVPGAKTAPFTGQHFIQWQP